MKNVFAFIGFLTLAGAVACSAGSQTLGNNDPVDSGTNGPGAVEDADGTSTNKQNSGSDAADGSAANAFGATATGLSCNPIDYPPAPTDCAIEGQYSITESFCYGGACGSSFPGVDNYQYVAEVTLDGTEVRISNGDNRNFGCHLTTGCDCIDNNVHYRFLGNGFVGLGVSDCGTGKVLYDREVGTKL